LRKRMIEKLMGKPPSPLEIQFKRKDGTWMWLELIGRALWEHGVPVGVQIVGEDITERKKFMIDLEALQDIGAVLASKTDLSEILPFILASLEKKMGYLFTAIALVNKPKNCLDNYMFGPSLSIAEISKIVG